MSKVLLAVKILLDLLIIFYLIGILALLFTGGFNITFFVFTIKSSSLPPLLQILVPLILIRVAITVEFKNFFLVIGSTFFALLLLEIFLRLWNPPIARPGMVQLHRPSDIYEWEPIPNAAGVGTLGEFIQINSVGLRDREYSLKKPQKLKRIAVIGDSFTFGMGVNLEDSYPKQLEKILLQKGFRADVINFGVIGYNMWQYTEILKRKALSYQPDLIIVGFFMDDIAKSIPPFLTSKDWKGSNPFETLFANETSYFYLWNFLKNFNHLIEVKYRYRRGYKYLQGIAERKAELGPDNPDHAYHKIQYGKMEQRVYDEFRHALADFFGVAENNQIAVVFALIPDASQLHDKERQAVNRFIAQAAAQLTVPFIDLTPVFEKKQDARPLYLFPLDAHTSAEGHRLIAEELASRIVDLDVLSE